MGEHVPIMYCDWHFILCTDANHPVVCPSPSCSLSLIQAARQRCQILWAQVIPDLLIPTRRILLRIRCRAAVMSQWCSNLGSHGCQRWLSSLVRSRLCKSSGPTPGLPILAISPAKSPSVSRKYRGAAWTSPKRACTCLFRPIPEHPSEHSLVAEPRRSERLAVVFHRNASGSRRNDWALMQTCTSTAACKYTRRRGIGFGSVDRLRLTTAVTMDKTARTTHALPKITVQ